jgi:hypothetical protein
MTRTAPVPTAVLAAPSEPARRGPSVPRRAAVAVTGLLACALPVVWGCATAVELATGVQADHRFHQVTGQGLLLSALWLGGLVPLVRAGLRGRRPSTSAALHALAFLTATVLAAALVPADLGLVAVITAGTTGLLWLALPVRPRLRGAWSGGLDLALAPAALLTAALVAPFALGQADLQHAGADEHAELTHYVDMAWVVLAIAALAAVAALCGAARSLSVWASAGLVVTGAARAAFTPDVTWSSLAVALGTAGLLLAAARRAAVRTGAARGSAGTPA